MNFIRTWLGACSLALLAAAPAAAEPGLDAWDKIHQVLSHPRCANCHVDVVGVPIWSGPSHGAKPRPHGMNIQGGASRIGAERGLLCMSCHTAHNAGVPHGPPGAPVWALAPASMQWFDKSSAEICAQIKDPARNGGRTLAQIADHVDHDELVHWGWKPGPGREPAPFSKDETVTFLREWARLDAPCPKPEGAAR